MKKKNKKLSSNPLFRLGIFLSIMTIIIIIIVILVNKKSIMTLNLEYWVPTSSLTVVDKEKGYYIIEPNTEIYSFESTSECNVSVVGKDYLEDGKNIYEDNHFYNKYFSEFKPRGTWISDSSKECSYKKTKDSISLNVKNKGETYEKVGTYKLVDKNTLLVTWANSKISNEMYTRIEYKQYIEPFYYYEGKVPDVDVFLRTNKKIHIDEIKNTMIQEKGVLYFNIPMLSNYIKKKYNMDFEEADMVYLNKNKTYNSNDYIYGGSAGLFVPYIISNDGYIDLMLPEEKRTDEEIIKRLEKKYKTMYERKNIEVKIEKTSSNTYICFIKFDMSNGDDFSRIESEEFKSIYDDSY